MANEMASGLALYATTGERVKQLPIKDGQVIFVQDKHRIALDFDGKRKFYNQIEELSTEGERNSMLEPINNMYYFVIETAVLWTYTDKWVQITSKPDNIVFIGTVMPELGEEKTLYVNKSSKVISVWDDSAQTYIAVSDLTTDATAEDIEKLFLD